MNQPWIYTYSLSRSSLPPPSPPHPSGDGIFHSASLWRFPAASSLSSSPGGRVQKRRGERENGTWNLLLETFSVSVTWRDQLLKSAIQPLDREMMLHFIDEESEPQFSLTQQVVHSYQVAWCSYGTETRTLIRSEAFHDLTCLPSIPSSTLFLRSFLPSTFLSSFCCLETNSGTS